MKTKHTISEIIWPYAFLLNNHKNIAGFKKDLSAIFADYHTKIQNNPEATKALKRIYKETCQEAIAFYDFKKTLPYQVDVVLCNEFCNAFAQDRRDWKNKQIVYEILPNNPYEFNCNGIDGQHRNSVNEAEINSLLERFAELGNDVVPYEVIVNKASMCDYLVKHIKIFNKQFEDEDQDSQDIIERLYYKVEMI